MMKMLDNKVVRILSSIIEWVVIVILVLLIVLVAVQKFSSRGNFFGYRIYTIISGSMIPTYGVGDTLLIKEMNSENIKIGDAVTYLGDSGSMNGKIITHQVVDIEFDEDGKYLFHTKGIANNIEDPIVYQDQVLGKVVHKFFFLSILGTVTTSMPLLFTFIVIPVAIIIAIEIAKLVYKKDDDEVEETEDEKVKTKDEPKEEEIKETVEEEIKEETKIFERPLLVDVDEEEWKKTKHEILYGVRPEDDKVKQNNKSEQKPNSKPMNNNGNNQFPNSKKKKKKKKKKKPNIENENKKGNENNKKNDTIKKEDVIFKNNNHN